MSLDIFSGKLNVATTKLQTQNINLFGQATNGALVLGTAGAVEGDVIQKREYVEVADPVDRDAYSRADQTADDVSTLMTEAHKIDYKFKPVQLSTGIVNRLQGGDKEATQSVIAEMAASTAEKSTKYLINRVFGEAAAVAQIAGANTYVDLAPSSTAAGDVSLRRLVNAASAWGDQYSDIAAIVMHSSLWFALLELDFFGNTQQLFDIGGLKVFSQAGIAPVVVSDIPALAGTAATSSANGSWGKAMLLRPNAVQLDAETNANLIQPVSLKENIEYVWQQQGSALSAIWNGKLTPAVLATIQGKKSLTSAQGNDKASWQQVRTGDTKQSRAILVNFQSPKTA